MNHDEAKFLLRARRPGGRDAGDAMFVEALAEAERDPKLKAWHEREERWDATIAAKLGQVAPPPGLREAILTGARASEPRRVWWQRPGWLAAAAGVVVLFAVALSVTGRNERVLSLGELATFALQDLAQTHDDHVGRPPGLASVQARLASASGSLRAGMPVNLDELGRQRCRSVRVGGREVFEICFQRDGVWFHLYATRGGAGARSDMHEGERLIGGERLAVAAWSDAGNSYALVTSAGREVLRKVL